MLLAQLGPAQPRDDARLAYFLRLIPEWMRVAVEFRHSSWHCEDVYPLLEAHRAAYCVMSGAQLPCVLRATTDFAYRAAARPRSPAPVRGFRIARPICAGGRPGSGNGTRRGRDVFAYFNNDGQANAVRECPRLARCMLGQ